MSSWTYSGSNETNLMKQKYGKLIEKQFNKSNVILGRVKKKADIGGKGIDIPLIQSIGGGVSAGSLATANENKIGLVKLNDTKSLYAAASVDRQTMKRAKKDEDSFVRMTKFPVKIATESFNRNLSRQILRNDIAGAGVLFTVGTTPGTQTTTKVYLDEASTHDLASFEAIEIGDLVDVWDAAGAYHAAGGQGNEVVDVVIIKDASVPGYAHTGSYIELGTALTAISAIGDIIYMQSSKSNELDGITGVLAATSGTYKNVSIGRRYQAYQNAASAALSTDLLNDLVINIKRQCGESPDLLLFGYPQFIKLLNLLEDQKRFNLPARDKKFKGVISFAGVEFMSADGPIPCVPDRMMDGDRVFALNTSKIELHTTPGGFEWFDEDGTVFLREASSDAYSARFGGYCELFVNPHFQGQLTALNR